MKRIVMKQLVNTEDGLEIVSFRRIGENTVPLGTYYDGQERGGKFITALNRDIFPVLEITVELLRREFKLKDSELQLAC